MTTEQKKDSKNSKDCILDIDDIRKILPHRYPFLLVDRVIKLEPNYGMGIKNVTANEPFFNGHFPQKFVMPGVLIVEALAQLAGLVWYKQSNVTGAITFLTGIDGVRFREQVTPGAQLILEARLIKQKARLIIVEATAKIGEKVACEGRLMFVVA